MSSNKTRTSQNRKNALKDLGFKGNELSKLKAVANAEGFSNVKDYLNFLHENHQKAKSESFSIQSPGVLKKRLKTGFGQIYQGDSLDFLRDSSNKETVNLIMTSPPFGLVRKKSYGNTDADAYCDWFKPFAEGFRSVLKEDGSLVIDIGGAWKRGEPTRSIYHFKLLIMLCEEFGFHLAQEFYWWNPAKLPSPAEWVNVRRVRVKDAVNCVWWLSKTPYPKASNRRILSPYSQSMRDLLKNGYEAKLRPSGHDISTKFSRNNKGSIPPNLLAIANTESNGRYQEFCRRHNIKVHPARFPDLLPEYFIRFLTDKGDLVLDPFGGSCVTGMVADKLQRKWVCVELDEEFIRGAEARFQSDANEKPKRTPVNYSIPVPCALNINEDSAPLAQDGGRQRPPSEPQQNAP